MDRFTRQYIWPHVKKGGQKSDQKSGILGFSKPLRGVKKIAEFSYEMAPIGNKKLKITVLRWPESKIILKDF